MKNAFNHNKWCIHSSDAENKFTINLNLKEFGSRSNKLQEAISND